MPRQRGGERGYGHVLTDSIFCDNDIDMLGWMGM